MVTLRKKIMSSQKGFTLVELLVVFTIMSMITAMSIITFSSYNRTQIFKTTVSDVTDSLNLVRSRAISRVKPSVCGTKPLQGYEFWYPVPPASNYYRISVLCGGTYNILYRVSLPANVTFTTPSGTTTFFNVSTGTVSTPTTITLSGYGKTATISVGQTGVVSVQ